MRSRESSLSFDCSSPQVEEGFAWAKKQALGFVNLGDPVGDWYEAALPGREAFCMRDLSHQCTGARVLGLQELTLNMFRHFACNISVTRDWCTFWEIDKNGHPCPADYRDDSSFWYNLPANFDVLQACFREFLWTGNIAYLEEPCFRRFYAATVGEYIARWDKDGDGIPEHHASYDSRGLGSYNEGGHGKGASLGGDLIVLQYAAFRAFAAMHEHEGSPVIAAELRRRAAGLKLSYNAAWWDSARQRLQSLMLEGGSFSDEDIPECQIFPLLCDIIDQGEKRERTLQATIEGPRPNVEARTYFPEIWYRYGRNEAAFEELMALVDRALPRREYPEVSFSVIGSMACGMMGIDVDARERMVATIPRLTTEVSWGCMDNVPVLDSLISVRHDGIHESVLENRAGPALRWKACFPVNAQHLTVDGKRMPAETESGRDGKLCSFVTVPMEHAAKRTISVGRF